MPAIDLNADLGEGCPWDEELLDRVTSASISCGAHAGDDRQIRATIRAAKARGVAIGAHPGFADREGFGRREQPVDRAGAERLVREQVAHLAGLAAPEGVSLRYIKPHGALYNQAQRDAEIARGVADAAKGLGLALFGLPASEVARAAEDAGVRYLAEGFADRGYRADGGLIPRGQPGAMLEARAEIRAQIATLARSGRVATLCIHGDDPKAVGLADWVRESLLAEGIEARGAFS